MSFVVEDGTSKTDANSYASVSFADAYFEDRGNAAWAAAASDDAKEQALVRATDYLETRFRFIGDKFDEEQALHFPVDEGEIPVNLKKATCEYALRALSAPLAPDPTTDERGLQVTSKTEKVGPLEESTTYAAYSVSVFKPYPAADALLRGLVVNNRRTIRA